MFCKKCGKEIKDGADFCENCGQKVYTPVPFRCENCGTIMLKESNYCPKCGWSIQKSEITHFLKKSIVYIIISVVLFVLFLMLIGFVSIFFDVFV